MHRNVQPRAVVAHHQPAADAVREELAKLALGDGLRMDSGKLHQLARALRAVAREEHGRAPAFEDDALQGARHRGARFLEVHDPVLSDREREHPAVVVCYPRARDLERTPGMGVRPAPVGVVEVKVVRHLHDVLVRERIQMQERRLRPDVLHAEALRVGVVGAEAVEPEAAVRLRRVEVPDRLDQVSRLVVVALGFAGEAVQEVPDGLHAVLAAPLEQLDVLETGRPLSHRGEHVVAQALDSGLDRVDARRAQRANVLRRQVCLHLPEELDVEVGVLEHRQHALEVAHVEDVVDDPKSLHAVTAAELRDLLDDPLRRLAPECHRPAVEATEGAVRAFPPPAASRRLEDHLRCVGRDRGMRTTLFEVRVEVGHR